MTETDYPHLCGEIETDLDLTQLASRLKEAGLPAEVRHSSHYEGGQYLSLQSETEVDMSLERINDREYIVRGDADALAELTQAAERLSDALRGLGMRHRLEIYAEDGSLARYFHYEWPA